MTKQEFLQIIKSIRPDKHIIAGRRGSEENVKIKIVLPLLQFLGYDIVQDLDFERGGADIVIVDTDLKPIMIVETKAWEEQIRNYLDQCLEYTLKLRTPFILITSGQETALYSFLVNLENPKEDKPIIEFNFQELLGEKSNKILARLFSLVSKENLLNGAEELKKAVRELLSKDRNIEDAKKEFMKRCEDFKLKIKKIKITDEEFVRLANNYPEEIRNALILAKDEFYKIAKEYKNIRVRYRSRTIGLEYLYQTIPRSKMIGLVEVNPYTGRLAFGVESWSKILSSSDVLKEIREFPRTVKNEAQIHNLSYLLRKAISKTMGNN